MPSDFLRATEMHLDQIRAYLGQPDPDSEDVVFKHAMGGLETDCARGNVFVWVDPCSLQVKGFVQGDLKQGHIFRIEVWREWRCRRIVGPALLAGFADLAQKAGAPGLYGECRWKSLTFWHRNGFDYEIYKESNPDSEGQSHGVELFMPLPKAYIGAVQTEENLVILRIELFDARPMEDDRGHYSKSVDAISEGDQIGLPTGWAIARNMRLKWMRLCLGFRCTIVELDDCGNFGVEVQGKFINISALDADIFERPCATDE